MRILWDNSGSFISRTIEYSSNLTFVGWSAPKQHQKSDWSIFQPFLRYNFYNIFKISHFDAFLHIMIRHMVIYIVREPMSFGSRWIGNILQCIYFLGSTVPVATYRRRELSCFKVNWKLIASCQSWLSCILSKQVTLRQ